jgi:rubrerythrin
MQMYTQLANTSADEAQKNIFTELASKERGHKSRLEDIYTNMAFLETWWNNKFLTTKGPVSFYRRYGSFSLKSFVIYADCWCSVRIMISS